MRGTFQILKIKGIPICVHWSFIFVVLWVFLGAYSSSYGINWSLLKVNVLSVITLFSIVILHELGHALMAQRVHIATTKIVLLPMGGVAMLENQNLSPRKDLLISLAGPVINFALVLLFIPLVLFFPDRILSQMIEFIVHPGNPIFLVNQLGAFHWFVFLFIMVNLSIGLFNLIPALPLDGGRILKAILSFRLDEITAVTYTVWIGNVLSLVVMSIGYWKGSLLLIILGVYVLVSSFGSIKRVKVMEHLRKTTIRGLVVSVEAFLSEHGVDPDREEWNFMQKENYIPMTTTLNAAIDRMLKAEVQFLPVIEDNDICGIISLRVIDDYIRGL